MEKAVSYLLLLLPLLYSLFLIFHFRSSSCFVSLFAFWRLPPAPPPLPPPFSLARAEY